MPTGVATDKTGADGFHNGFNYSPTSSLNKNLSSSNSSLNYDCLKTVGAQVVGFHFCQADNNITCMVPEFVHSLAAYMAAAPQLSAYRELLLQDIQLQHILSLKQCIQDPSSSLVKGVLEPLEQIKLSGKLDTDSCIVLVDGLNEAEFHKPDYGDTIASFLVSHIDKFPNWLKLVLTVHTSMIEVTSSLPFPRIYIDKCVGNEQITRDLQEYVNHRVVSSANIKRNMALKTLDAAVQSKFCSHLQTLSKGSFLFCKLTLDLIEQGHVVLKSSNYKILPVSLSEVFLLMFNLKFPSVRAYERVNHILEVCLATLYPLSNEEIYEAVNSGLTEQYQSWEDFQQRLSLLSGILYQRRDNRFTVCHPALRDWLIRREEPDNIKFVCDLRYSHCYFSYLPSSYLTIIIPYHHHHTLPSSYLTIIISYHHHILP